MTNYVCMYVCMPLTTYLTLKISTNKFIFELYFNNNKENILFQIPNDKFFIFENVLNIGVKKIGINRMLD